MDVQRERAEIMGPELRDLDRTLWDLFSSAAASFPVREAVVSMWQPAHDSPPEDEESRPNPLRLTYADLLRRSSALAQWLLSLAPDGLHGSGRDGLAVCLWNSAEWALCFWAAARLGMAFVPLDPRAVADAAGLLAAVRPRVLVVQDEDAARGVDEACHGDSPFSGPTELKVQCSGPVRTGWLSLPDLAGTALSRAPARGGGNGPDHNHPCQGPPTATALVVFTSGTTATPKACPHTHRNLVSSTHDYDPNPSRTLVDRWLVHTPASHIFAVNNALRAWRVGSCVVFPSRSFDIRATIRALVEEQCTIMSAVPTLVRALLSHPEFPGRDRLNLQIVSVAATMIRVDDLRACREGLGARNAIQAYGMSEGAPVISWRRQDEMLVDGLHEGVGKVLPGAGVRICEPAGGKGGGRVLSRGEVGELHIGGSTVISGYLGDCGVGGSGGFYEDELGNWLATGDQASMDADGVIRILGRYKDLIIRGGENISPARMEAALAELPGLVAQVVGVPDEVAGQVPVAVVKLPAQGVRKTDIFARARSLGPGYALAAVVLMKEDLGLGAFPVTAVGKVKKEELKRIVVDFMAGSAGEPIRSGGGGTALPAPSVPDTPSVPEAAGRVMERQVEYPKPQKVRLSNDHPPTGSQPSSAHAHPHPPARPRNITPPDSPSYSQASLEANEHADQKTAPSPLGVRPVEGDELELATRLLDVWEDLTGTRPRPHDSISTFADSITILRYCDRVLGLTGLRMYLQDVVLNETVAGQAKLLVGRRNDRERGRGGKPDWRQNPGPANNLTPQQREQEQFAFSTASSAVGDPRSVLATQRDAGYPAPEPSPYITAAVLGSGNQQADIEDVIPIKDSLRRLAVGSRPQSYHCRMVFRFRNVSPDHVREGLEAGLRTRQMLRTILAKGRESDPLVHVALRPAPRVLDAIIRRVTVSSPAEADAITRDDSPRGHSTPFMFQAVVVTDGSSPDTVLLSLTYNHSVMDAMSLLHWHTDLDRIIHSPCPGSEPIPPLTPFRHFAGLLHLNQCNRLAEQSIDFHVRRLRGISRLARGLWPPRRAPGWMMGNDSASPLARERARVREEVWNGRWASVAADFRFPRSGRVVRLLRPDRLRGLRGVEPSVLAKSAVALLNVLQTGEAYAIFNSWESGRKWPFVPAWMETESACLPPAMSIDGPTVEWVVNMVAVDRTKTVGEFLAAATSDQNLLAKHAHAPWGRVLEGLREEAGVAEEASRRQGFVWDVSVGMGRGGLGRMEAVARYDWPDCGLFWNAFMIDKYNLQFVASWDTAQMDDVEVDRQCDVLAEVIRGLADAKNWDQPLGSVVGGANQDNDS